MSKRILILNGPGTDEPVPGTRLEEVRLACADSCERLGFVMDFRHSEDDDAICAAISRDAPNFDLLIIHPAGKKVLGHADRMERYGTEIMALAERGMAVIEIHWENIFRDERPSTAPLQRPGAPIGLVSGLGMEGFKLAIESMRDQDNVLTSEPAPMTIRVINGPNLNLLGTREPEIYGRETLDDIRRNCEKTAESIGVTVEFFQSNHEGEIVELIQGAIDKVDALIINAAAYTHTSVAIHDALKAFTGLKIELHISNPHARDSFRHISFVSSAVDAVIAGMGVGGYPLAVKKAAEILLSCAK